MSGILELVYHLDPLWIYCLILVITFGENLFPPFPGDVILVFSGYLSGIGRVHWLVLLLFAYGGSIIGFMTLYAVGASLDQHIIRSRKWRWLPYGSIDRVENWFTRHGPIIILTNRFLMGVRSAIALFAGMSHLDRRVAFVYASISIAIWNSVLIFSGKWLGKNWQDVQHILVQYRRILTVVVVMGILVLIGRYFVLLIRKPHSKDI